MRGFKQLIYFIVLSCQVDVSKVVSLCKLMESLLFTRGGPDLGQDPARLNPLIANTFVFCFLWTIGGNILESQWDSFDTFTRGLFEDHPDVKVRFMMQKSFGCLTLLAP